MSISSSLLIAQSGLRSSELRASLVSSNIANANTDGYVRREADQSSIGSTQTGRAADVQVVRNVDERLISLSRGAASDVAAAHTRTRVLESHLTTLGEPGDEISPAAHLARFQSALDMLGHTPSDASIQRDAFDSAEALVRSINGTASTLADATRAAQDEVTGSISVANESLARLAELNAKVSTDMNGARDPDVLDQIGRELQTLAEQMDITATTDAMGRSVVQTKGGTELLRGDRVSELSYQGGTLRAGEIDITPGRDGVRGFTSGRLAGAISLIEDDIPQMQRQIDELAAGLVGTFEEADGSLAAGEAGLFTDNGAALGDVEGLATRLSVNARVDPGEEDGALWRMRDGVGADTPGFASDTTQIDAFVTALADPRDIPAETGLGGLQTLGNFAADLVGAQQRVGTSADEAMARRTVALRAFEDARGAIEGVNIDEELQKLLTIEKSYAANAKVLTTLDEMVTTLLNAF